ncbi:hypothetical protein [uncultured Campylobacter sp.]|jgi:hypothetical protein|uniref:hypothetical protein n=1 Tax=uncultured Campylobacter sp. TaxID=218934 RepID=UPI0026086E60|nr:hypothetical protein [uncultured Campylobacter sp.]
MQNVDGIKEAQTVYFNGFSLSIASRDVKLALFLTDKIVAETYMSFHTLKTLQEAINKTIEEIERSAGTLEEGIEITKEKSGNVKKTRNIKK